MYPGSAHFNLRANWRCHENVMEKSGKRFQRIWLAHFDGATAVALLGSDQALSEDSVVGPRASGFSPGKACPERRRGN